MTLRVPRALLSPRKCFALSGDPKTLAKEASARSGDSTRWYGPATSAKHPAASSVRAGRSRAQPGGSSARRGARVSFFSDVIAATFRNATPLVYGTVGETYCERAGILNLGIEGTMYVGAFAGFASRSRPARSARAGRGDRVRARRGPADGPAHGHPRRQPARLRARPDHLPHRRRRVRQPAAVKGIQEQAHRAVREDRRLWD